MTVLPLVLKNAILQEILSAKSEIKEELEAIKEGSDIEASSALILKIMDSLSYFVEHPDEIESEEDESEKDDSYCSSGFQAGDKVIFQGTVFGNFNRFKGIFGCSYSDSFGTTEDINSGDYAFIIKIMPAILCETSQDIFMIKANEKLFFVYSEDIIRV